MTARTYPDQPDFVSDAERVVWQALLEQLPDDAVLFANRRFTDRDGDSEADLIVAWPEVGVAVIEVRGGHVSLDGPQHLPAAAGRGARPQAPPGLRGHLPQPPG